MPASGWSLQVGIGLDVRGAEMGEVVRLGRCSSEWWMRG
jgi:hypothetical protein